MKKIILFTLMSFSMNALALGPAHETAKNLALQQACQEIHTSVNRLSGYELPAAPGAWFAGSHNRSHEQYKAKRTEIKNSPRIRFLTQSQVLSEYYLNDLISTCQKSALTLSHIVGRYRNIKASESLAVVRLEQQNSYVVELRSKKSEVTLDGNKSVEENVFDALEAHAKNSSEAVIMKLLVGETTFNRWTEGQILASNFNQWSYFFNDEISRQKIKVMRKKHIKKFFAKLSDSSLVEMKEIDFASALTSFKGQAASSADGQVLVHQRIVGHDSYTLMPRSKLNTEIVRVQPMTRYFANVKIKNNSLFNFDQEMQNLVTTNGIEVEISKAIYASKDSLFRPSMNFGTLLNSGRFDYTTGNITKKFTATDSNWNEVILRDGSVLFLEKAAIDRGF